MPLRTPDHIHIQTRDARKQLGALCKGDHPVVILDHNHTRAILVPIWQIKGWGDHADLKQIATIKRQFLDILEKL